MMRVTICLTTPVHGYAASPKQPFISGARLACRVVQYSWVKMDSDNGLANSNTPENDSNRIFSVKGYFLSVLPAALNFRHLSRNADNPLICIGFNGGPSTRGGAYPISIAAPVAVPVVSVDK
jgi:hypothetical protein